MGLNANEQLPTNIITGFLGVGKTTAIMHLLAHKPTGERWAVLVNEFGEVGIDVKFYSSDHQEKTGVYITEVAGGCMCCTAGLSMQISLNMLLARAKPDRLFIEPTGLGHPKEILAALSAGYYTKAIELRATIALVDAKKIRDVRYTAHDTFNQQLEIADIIVANKADTYVDSDLPDLLKYLSAKQLLVDKHFYSTIYGKIAPEWLNEKSSVELETNVIQKTTDISIEEDENAVSIPECGYLKIENKGEGFNSTGWLFLPSYVFDKVKLFQVLHGIDAERLKAIFSTSQGVCGYNKADGILTEVLLDGVADNRIEIIFSSNEQFEELPLHITQCCVNQTTKAGLKT